MTQLQELEAKLDMLMASMAGGTPTAAQPLTPKSATVEAIAVQPAKVNGGKGKASVSTIKASGFSSLLKETLEQRQSKGDLRSTVGGVSFVAPSGKSLTLALESFEWQGKVIHKLVFHGLRVKRGNGFVPLSFGLDQVVDLYSDVAIGHVRSMMKS